MKHLNTLTKTIDARVSIPMLHNIMVQAPLTRKVIAKAKTRQELELLACLYNKNPAWVGYVTKAREIKQFKKKGY